MSRLRALLRSVTRSRETGWAFAIAGTLVYVAWLVLGHVHHELWRDEIHPWALARAADGFWDIVTGDRVYDGHPPAWYWYLRFWTFLTSRAWGLHAATIAAMGAAALLFLRHGPFPRPLKILLLASYLLGYEYGVLSRNYTLTWLFLVVFCSVLHPLRPRFIWLAILLVLLALTSVFGAFIACALIVMLLPFGISIDGSAIGTSTVTFRVHPRFVVTAVALVFALGFFVWSTAPPDPNYNTPDWHFDSLTTDNIKAGFHRLGYALLPIRSFHGPFWMDVEHFWNEHTSLALAVSVGMLALSVLALLPGWFEMGGLLIGLALISVFMIVRYGGDMRHVGNFLFVLVAACWIHRLRAPRRNHLVSTLLLLIIAGFQLESFVVAARADWTHPFSGGREMARRIEKRRLQNLPIVAGPDALVLTVTGYLDRPFISSQSEEYNVTQVFHSRRRGFSAEALVERAAREVRGRHHPVLVLSTYPMPSPGGGLKFALLEQTSGESVDESYWLYRMEE